MADWTYNLNQDCLDIFTQVVEDIKPGVSGWKGVEDETYAMNALILIAMQELGYDMEDEWAVVVQNRIYEVWTDELGPPGEGIDNSGARESTAVPGQVNVANAATLDYFESKLD